MVWVPGCTRPSVPARGRPGPPAGTSCLVQPVPKPHALFLKHYCRTGCAGDPNGIFVFIYRSTDIKMCRIFRNTSKLSIKWISFGIGCLQSLSTSPCLAIAACTKDIRSTFHMNEDQYGLIATLYLNGSICMFLPGILLDKYGPVLVSTISLILTLFSHGAIWQLAKLEPFPAQEYLLYVAFFLGGLSFAASISVTFSVNLSNFQQSSHGKVTGVLGLALFFGASICNELYVGFFSPNLSDYFLMVTVYSGIVCVLMILFVRKTKDDDGYTSMDSDELRNDVSADDRSGINPLKTLEFFILLTAAIVIGAGAHVLLFMVTTDTESLGLRQYTKSLLTLSTIAPATLLLIIGILSDSVIDRFPRMFVALIPTIAQVFALFIALFEIDHIQVLIIVMLINSVMFVINDTLIPSELHECFGDTHYGKILGICEMGQGFATIGLEYFTTWFYDNEKRKQNSPDEWCHGKVCLFPGLLLMLILNLLVSLLLILYLCRRKEKN